MVMAIRTSTKIAHIMKMMLTIAHQSPVNGKPLTHLCPWQTLPFPIAYQSSIEGALREEFEPIQKKNSMIENKINFSSKVT